MKKPLYHIAFTLAEVLIVLGIIGIVADMTIPTLMNGVNNKELKVAWQKSFSVMSQATTFIMMDNGGSMTSLCTNNDDDCIANLYGKYLRSIKTCAHGTSGCFYNTGEPWKYITGTPIGSWGADSGIILQDGSIYNLEYWDATCNTAQGTLGTCGRIYVDVNGKKQPNTIGKDIFVMWIQKDKIIPGGTSGDALTCNTNPPSGTGQGCGAVYLMGN